MLKSYCQPAVTVVALLMFTLVPFNITAASDTVTIDFENFPGPDGILGTGDDIPVSDGDSIGSQFESLGVVFSLSDGTSPTLGPPLNGRDYNVYGPPYHSAPNILRPSNIPWQGCEMEYLFQDIIMDFSTPVDSVTITSIDSDEPWTLRVFNSDGAEIASSQQPGGGNYQLIQVVVSVDGSAGFITRAVIDVSEGNSSPNPECQGGPEYYDDLIFTPVDVILDVDIDIRPGDDVNRINLGSSGVVPVAILSSETFDAATVNPETVSLAGATVKMVGKSGKYLCNSEDTNGDGLQDLLCQVYTVQFLIETGQTIAVLEAVTYDGTAIRGEDLIEIVPDN